jgi:hypothetical protein
MKPRVHKVSFSVLPNIFPVRVPLFDGPTEQEVERKKIFWIFGPRQPQRPYVFGFVVM